MPFQEDHRYFLSVPQTGRLSPPSSRYSRHEAEFGACLHTLTLLNIVGWDDALAAHFVFGFVPVGVLERGQHRHTLEACLLRRQTQRKPLEVREWDKHVRSPSTLVTATMVSTSPLQKGRSCSAVPWKLYLAIHSVPDGQAACRIRDGCVGTA